MMKWQVPVVTATFSIDQSCQYHEGSFPYFKGLGDSVRYVFAILWNSVSMCFYNLLTIRDATFWCILVYIQSNEWYKCSKGGRMPRFWWLQIQTAGKIWKWWSKTGCCKSFYSVFVCRLGVRSCACKCISFRLYYLSCHLTPSGTVCKVSSFLIAQKLQNFYLTIPKRPFLL